MDATLRLTDLLGRPVVAADGVRVGRVADFAVDHAERYPRVTAIGIRRGRRVLVEPWSSVRRLEPQAIVVDAGDGEPRADLYLARDLLDAQVVDIAGQRLARVGEIELALRGTELRAIAVDVSLGAVLRRLGLSRLGTRMAREEIAWDGLHFATGRGHQVQLASPAAAVHRLEPAELLALISRLPPERGAEVLAAVPAERAARVRELPRRRHRPRFPVMRVRKRAPS
jgi:sporulation protein YlmC with PRC-barrel domain